MRFKIDWSSHIVGSKFTVFASFYFVFEGNFPSTNPLVAYIWRGDLTEGFLRYRIEGLIFGGAYTWRGLFSEFYGISKVAISGAAVARERRRISGRRSSFPVERSDDRKKVCVRKLGPRKIRGIRRICMVKQLLTQL